MRHAAPLLLVFTASLARGDASVAPTESARSRASVIAAVTLLADPVRAPSADAVGLCGQVRVAGGRAVLAKTSVLDVRDASGKLVFSSSHAFMFGGEGTINLGLGFSSSAGPNLPSSLPAGDYLAVWTLDGVRSNEARFAVGPAAPPPLSIERTGDGRFVMHLFNPGPGDLELPDSIEESLLIVDGKTFKRQGLDWDGSSGLPRGRAFGMLIFASEYGAPAPKHTLALKLGRWTSNTLTW